MAAACYRLFASTSFSFLFNDVFSRPLCFQFLFLYDFKFYFMCLSVLLVCLCVCITCMHDWYLWNSEEGAASCGTGFRNGRKPS